MELLAGNKLRRNPPGVQGDFCDIAVTPGLDQALR
jgi:hypothetical protein